MSWMKLFKYAMNDIRGCRFSQRRIFFKELEKAAQERADCAVAWPDALLFLEPGDWLHAAQVANINTVTWI